jgi:radical SAM superfamily enzyme YgiQ (UPF0313 family)
VYYFLGRLPLLGNLTMGTLLRRAGHEVSVFKENVVRAYHDRRDAFHPAIRSADVVGITAVTQTIKRAYKIADALKRQFPEKRVIMGGPHVSAMPQEAVSHADHVVVGEGESVIRDLVEGRVSDTIIRGQSVNMNEVPPIDLDLLMGYKKKDGSFRLPVAPIMASRGCPYDCIFCSVTKLFGRKYRVKDPEQIMEEVRKRYDEGFREAFFYDDNFAANPRKTKEFLRMLIDADLDFHWSSQFSVHVARDPELVDLLVKSKCRTLFIGVESINPEALRDYHKQQTVEFIRESLNTLTGAGLGVHAMFILGADSDTPGTTEETVRFSKECGAETTQFSILFPIPGTDLYHQVRQEKRIFLEDWDCYDGSHSVFVPKRMSPMELQKSFIKAYKQFYNTSVLRWAASRLGAVMWHWHNRRYMRFLRRFTRRLRRHPEVYPNAWPNPAQEQDDAASSKHASG